MEAQLERIREQQKETWNKFSAGWRKWDDFTMDWLRPMGTEIITSLKLKPTAVVLDIAAGTGEPGLTIAPIVTNGKVVITDLAEGMLDVARDNALRKGITNCEFVRCDVCELPFDDETFDTISCRFGFMFFPDMLLAAKEMARVLKPGGRIAAAVWGAPNKNFWITATMSVINEHMQLPAPPQGAPGMFRCAAPSFLADLFAQAGFQNTTEKEVTGKLNAGTTANYWSFMNDVAAPVVAAMSKADDNTKEQIKNSVFHLLNENSSNESLALDYGTIIISGEK
ncbi:class I SAM-dependent methyltransferase [uncultured Hymenobacter sp.]|uniref:class I SAM-dependent methyltransferase n=1 Tax=uncultured Hymenobacter sp. TaxID=170016 RepID=UPI0035CB9B6E